MTQDEIIEMARKAGMAYEEGPDVYVANIDDLQDFAKLVAAKERPAPCARHCEATAFQITIKNLESQLAQPKQEPVAWLNRDSVDGLWHVSAFKTDNLEPSIPLYKHPAPQRTWAGLTPEEIEELMDTYDVASADYARAIEAKLKEKNT